MGSPRRFTLRLREVDGKRHHEALKTILPYNHRKTNRSDEDTQKIYV